MARHRETRRRAALTAAALACALALALAGCGSKDERTSVTTPAPSPYAGMVREPAPVVGGATLPDVADSGKPRALQGTKDGLLLVYFGYTQCPDVCPTTMSDVRVALKGLPATERKRVRLAMVTVDPRRDTPAVLTRYVHAFFPTGIPLRTAEPGRLARVAGTFGAAYKVTKTKDGTVEVMHTAFVYAVDDTGRVRVQWAFGTRPVDYRKDIRLLLRTSAQPGATTTNQETTTS